MKTDKVIYINHTEEIKYGEMSEREKEIYRSGQDNPPTGAYIIMAIIYIIMGFTICAECVLSGWYVLDKYCFYNCFIVY